MHAVIFSKRYQTRIYLAVEFERENRDEHFCSCDVVRGTKEERLKMMTSSV